MLREKVACFLSTENKPPWKCIQHSQPWDRPDKGSGPSLGASLGLNVDSRGTPMELELVDRVARRLEMVPVKVFSA